MPATISRKRFRKLLIIAIAVPLMVMLTMAGVLALQVGRLLKAASWVEHNDVVIAGADEALKLTLDMETGLRGYLVTGDPQFLEPYNEALKVIDAKATTLKNLVSDNAPQVTLLQRIDDARLRWRVYAVSQIASRQRGGDYASAVQGLEGKRQMDVIRALYRSFVDTEDSLRDIRSRTARQQSRITLWLVAGVGLIGGSFLALLSRRQFLEISGTYTEALAVAHDLNTQLEARVIDRTRELQQRSEQLREANRELEAFGYSISHDLRAPMRHISGFADLMRSTVKVKLNADELENLDIIYDTARLAGRMVDDLLAFSRIGRTHLKLQSNDMNDLVARCRRELEPDFAGREIQWDIHPLPAVTADPLLLKMTMLNLMSNAIKYTGKTPLARIEIGTLEPGHQPTPPGEVDKVAVPSHLIYIRDNGVGFDMAFSGKLFGVFQRLHRAEDFEGTGIGLANVRRILVRHGGKVWAEGALGQGATFYFTLPIDVRTDDDHEPA